MSSTSETRETLKLGFHTILQASDFAFRSFVGQKMRAADAPARVADMKRALEAARNLTDGYRGCLDMSPSLS